MTHDPVVVVPSSYLADALRAAEPPTRWRESTMELDRQVAHANERIRLGWWRVER